MELNEKRFRKRLKSKGHDSGKIPPFVPLLWDLLNSKAYLDLPYSAAKALPFFLGKVKLPWRDPCKFKTEFKFSHPEAKRLGFTSPTFANVIRNLSAVGLIDLVEGGGLKGFGRGYNIFRLSNRWQDYGTERFQKPGKTWG